MPLEGYFDDSGSSKGEPVYVLAGFVAPYGNWIAFSDAWQAHLDANQIHNFKTYDAMSLEGEFAKGWSAPLRNKLVLELAEIISRFASLRVSATVKRQDYDDFFDGVPEALAQYRDPYSLLFFGICRVVMEHQYRNGITEPCDFIFDQQGRVGFNALSWWPVWPSWTNPDRAHLIGNPPIFRDDKKVRPLQAADLYAYLVRDRLLNRGKERVQTHAAFRALQSVPLQNFYLTRERLSALRASQLVSHGKFLGLL